MTYNKKNLTVKKVTIIINNETGFHARPSAVFAKTANNFNSEITVSKGTESVNGKSILGLMTLAAVKGTKLSVKAIGVDAESAISAISAVAKNNFEEVEK